MSLAEEVRRVLLEHPEILVEVLSRRATRRSLQLRSAP
jgi:hypothetical protein